MNLAEVQRIVLLIFLGVLVYLLIQAWNTDYGMANRIVEDQRAPMVEQDQRLEEVSEIDAIGPTRDSGEIENDLPDSTEFAPAAIEQRATTIPSSQPPLIKVETPPVLNFRQALQTLNNKARQKHLPILELHQVAKGVKLQSMNKNRMLVHKLQKMFHLICLMMTRMMTQMKKWQEVVFQMILQSISSKMSCKMTILMKKMKTLTLMMMDV